MKKILHTPEGVRDIYNIECGKKLALEGRIKKIFHLYGYHDIQTPTFEYFEVFREEIGTIPAKDLYRFFDKEGNTLVLRPDMTPSIARAVAKYFMDEDMPIRHRLEAEAEYLGYISYVNSKLEDKEGYFTLYDIGSIILESK